jgi:hypothetical protein
MTDAKMDKAQLLHTNYVVYILRDGRCSGSQQLMDKIDPYKEDFVVVDVCTLETRPEWLDGTPILADISGDDGLIYRGSAALQQIDALYPDDDVAQVSAMAATSRATALQ